MQIGHWKFVEIGLLLAEILRVLWKGEALLQEGVKYFNISLSNLHSLARGLMSDNFVEIDYNL